MIAQGAQIPGCPANPVGQCGTIKLDALAGVDLGLPVQRQVIGVLGDQHLGDQRFGRNAALDDPRWRRGLHHRALAGPAAVARTASNQHTEGSRHHVEPFGHILADLVEAAATARTSLVRDIDEPLDPFEMGRQRATVDLARPITAGLTYLGFVRGLGMGERRLDILKPQLQLVRIELLGTSPEPVAHESVEDRLEPGDLGIGGLQLLGLLDDDRAQRVNVVGKVGLDQHKRQ